MSKTIFFVDDDEKRMESYIDYLRESGYKVILECDCNHVIEKYVENREKIDLIILDMMMPVDESLKLKTNYGRRAGLHLLEEIRDVSVDIPVIIFTVVRDWRLRKKIEEEWKITYLEKPLLPSKLAEEIEKVLETRG